MNKEIVLKKVLTWSRGLAIEGETKEELISNLKAVHWNLECELDQQKKILEDLINDLDIPD